MMIVPFAGRSYEDDLEPTDFDCPVSNIHAL